ncbi:MAG: AbrB/MazE/SpoVT family DNA-binding domain-containing protein [Methylocystis sp.]|nr:AbrB/MazE/SpoVT family DNA-binding domain-containing protein [Methylocystis sp.]MBI3274887.1 AbrB/MazE/SpoVT family DNA-binding domain-containing protein [Methylocystis sp.]
MRVSKWGNSLAVRLPAKLVEELGVKEGDEVSITVKAEHAVEIEKTPALEELFAKVRKIRRPLPADFKFNREEAHERR